MDWDAWEKKLQEYKERTFADYMDIGAQEEIREEEAE